MQKEIPVGHRNSFTHPRSRTQGISEVQRSNLHRLVLNRGPASCPTLQHNRYSRCVIQSIFAITSESVLILTVRKLTYTPRTVGNYFSSGLEVGWCGGQSLGFLFDYYHHVIPISAKRRANPCLVMTAWPAIYAPWAHSAPGPQ